MKMFDYKGRTIGLAPFERDGVWSARIELYEPGTGPRTHSPSLLSFTATASTEANILDKALAYAKARIDDLQPRRRNQKRK